MDSKFRKILSLALHPNTKDGELSSAIDAARAMVAARGFDALLDEHDAYAEYEYTIPQSFQHTWIEKILTQAKIHKLDFNLIKCRTNDNTVSGSLVIKFRVGGNKKDIDDYTDVLAGYFNQVKETIEERKKTYYYTALTRSSSPSRTDFKSRVKKPGFFKKFFG
jgi:hypothetical protein